MADDTVAIEPPIVTSTGLFTFGGVEDAGEAASTTVSSLPKTVQ